MPRRLATTLSAAVLAGAILTPAVSRAEGGYGRELPSRVAPPPYGPVRRCPPPRPTCRASAPYGGPVIVRAYLPRNNALPMYNEPPQRFCGAPHKGALTDC